MKKLCYKDLNLWLGLTIFVFLTLLFIIPIISFFFNVSVNKFQIIVAGILVFLFVYLENKRDIKKSVIIIIITINIFLFWLYILINQFILYPPLNFNNHP